MRSLSFLLRKMLSEVTPGLQQLNREAHPHLPFGALWYTGTSATNGAIGYAQHYSRSHHAVIRVYDTAGNVIETHEHKGDFKEPEACLFFGLVVVGGLRVKGSCVLCFWATRAGAGPESLIRMSWLPRLQIALFVVGIVGMLFLIFGHWERSSVAYFALGMVISGGSFLLNLIISGVTAIFQPRLRKVSIWMAIISLLMLLGLVLPWRMP